MYFARYTTEINYSVITTITCVSLSFTDWDNSCLYPVSKHNFSSQAKLYMVSILPAKISSSYFKISAVNPSVPNAFRRLTFPIDFMTDISNCLYDSLPFLSLVHIMFFPTVFHTHECQYCFSLLLHIHQFLKMLRSIF